MSISRGFSNGPPLLLRSYAIVLLAVLAGCTSLPLKSAALDPYIVDLERSRYQVSEDLGIIVQNKPFNARMDGRSSTIYALTSVPIDISVRQLKRWAKPHINAPGGKPLQARLILKFHLREQVSNARKTRVIVQPLFEVYVSNFGDRRQWIEWMSNRTVEELVESLLQDQHK